jgi:hypothetical protein
MVTEKRAERSTFRGLIRYTVVVFEGGKLKFLDLTGKAFNISKNGICFVTRYPLQAGSVIEFKNQVLHHSQGVVMWIKKRGGMYLAGTRLIGKDGTI